ncbi:Exopolysaccharide biosynthesis protein [Beggiatoa sp. PS]|nr:Exopolysaccharide biosynthesis protein [Beggiatoa sp. PS]
MNNPLTEPLLANNQQNDDNELDLRVYWTTFNKYKGRIIGLTLLIGILTTLFTFSLQPIYRSTTTLLLEFDKPNVISIEEVYGFSPSGRDYYQTQLEILKSRQLAEKIVDKLNLISHRIFQLKPQKQGFFLNWRDWLPGTSSQEQPKAPPTMEQRRNDIVNALMAKLTISPVRNSQLVNIRFESSDAQLAADVPNALANIYIESDLEAKLEMTQKAASWLTERVDGLGQKLSQSEKALQDYLERENLVNVTGVKSVATRKIEETTSNLVNANQMFAEIESAYRQVQALRGRSIKSFESIPTVLQKSINSKLEKSGIGCGNESI